VAEVRSAFPAAREATLVDSRIVTDPTAVLSVRPGVEDVRPPPQTTIPNLFLAGDWTATGWPSTMEGAVRSGRAAAQVAANQLGIGCQGLSPDLPRGPLVRWLVGAGN
jgi:zeta-carotene desaturase